MAPTSCGTGARFEVSTESKRQVSLGAIAALLLIVGGIFTFRTFNNPSEPRALPDRMTFVDVSTGERMQLDLGKIRVIPAKNPRTGERTLLPCGLAADGKWVIDGHYREAVLALGETNRHVDPSTLELKEGS